MSAFGGKADIRFALGKSSRWTRVQYQYVLHVQIIYSGSGNVRRVRTLRSCQGVTSSSNHQPKWSPVVTFSKKVLFGMLGSCLAIVMASAPASAQQQRKPNILVIMGDDVGWFNVGAYHQGIMSGKTPNLDKLAAEGMRFTDYYAEASCTAGRANFITGQIPLRTGLTTVGQAGADVGMPAQAVTLATALKAQGYATGQFGKNHLGDLNKYLPTVHGFDEFFGYLYHLDAMSDPYWYSFPVNQDYYNKNGPRSLIH